jgi:hypothetical protein
MVRNLWGRSRRDHESLVARVDEISQHLNAVSRKISDLDSLTRTLHTDSWNAAGLRAEAASNELKLRFESLDQLIRSLDHSQIELIRQNHADIWEADEKRALSLADVVLLSLSPQLEAMRREVIALIGEKAVEVFHEVSRE